MNAWRHHITTYVCFFELCVNSKDYHLKHFVVITWDCTITFCQLGTLHSVNFKLLLKGCLMFPSNVLPNNKISLNFKINFGSLNSSHRGLRGPKFPESHTSDFQACKSHVTLLRVNVKKIYINVSSHILTRKPVSVRHYLRQNCTELIHSDRPHVQSQFPVMPC